MPSSSRKAPVSLREHLRSEKQQGALTQADIATEVKASLKAARDVVLIPLEQLDEGRFNPRRGFDERELEALADTIGATGLVHPLLVRSNPDDARRFETIAGARRLRAAHIVWGRGDLEERARVAELPCMIKELSETQAFITAVAENASRSDLTLAEMIDAVRRLRDDTQWSGAEIARRIGRHKGYVSEILAVADHKELSRLVGEAVIAPKTAVVIAHMPAALKEAAIARAWNGQLKTKADAERLRENDRLLAQPRPAPLSTRGQEDAAPAAAREGSPVNHSSTTNKSQQGSPANVVAGDAQRPLPSATSAAETASSAGSAGPRPSLTASARVVGQTGGRDAHALRLAETMAVAVDAFVDHMGTAPRLPDDDPALVLAERARKALAVFEAMRHINA